MDLPLLLVVVALFLVLLFFINKKISELKESQKPSDELLTIIKMLQEGSQKDRQVLLENLRDNSKALNDRLDNAATVIGQVQKNIGEMSEIGRSMRDLQEFLQSPKLRGNVGEQVLKELLGQMLPKNSFHLQYAFKSGEKVDAAIVTSGGIVPIDSKFPMENFRKLMAEKVESEQKQLLSLFERDVKKHINDISKKYILTDEGTIDYALMYIPSEAVYYEIVNNPNLFDYAATKRILPVSPTTFYAYMRAILMSFEGQKIQSEAKKIFASIRAIQKDYEKVEENMSILQRHVVNANNMLGNVVTGLSTLGHKISSVYELGKDVNKEIPSGEGNEKV